MFVLAYTHTKKTYIPYETMLERNTDSTSSSCNKHKSIDDNSNHYGGYGDRCNENKSWLFK